VLISKEAADALNAILSAIEVLEDEDGIPAYIKDALTALRDDISTAGLIAEG